jgi:hypothetical protein
MAVNIFQALDAGLEDPEVAVGPEVIRGLLAREASDGGGLWPGVRNRGQMEDVHRCQGDQGPQCSQQPNCQAGHVTCKQDEVL